MAEFGPSALASTQPDSPDWSKFVELWQSAIEAYKTSTGYDLLNDPLRSKLEHCTSIDGLISALNMRGKNFEKFRKDGHKFWNAMEFISKMLSIVTETSGEVAAASKVPGGKAIFVAVGHLLQATRGVSEVYDAIEKVFDSGQLADFFKRIETHFQSPISITDQLKEIFVKMLVEVMKLISLLTKYIENIARKARLGKLKRIMLCGVRRAKDLGNVLLDRNDVKGILDTLRDFTAEQNLRIATETHVRAMETHSTVNVISKDLKTMHSDVTKDVAGVAVTLADVQADTRQTISQAKTLVTNQTDRNIRKWLKPLDPSLNHDRVRKARQSDTCDWIFGKEFQEWRGKECGVYWLHGSPGSGKSVLCSSIIDELTSENELVSYFYFNFSDGSKQTITGLLASLVYQLATRSTSCHNLLKQLYEKNKSSLNPREETLVECLVEMLRSCKRAFVVLDVLDEFPMATRDVDLLSLLDSIIRKNIEGLRLLVTSRLESDIKTRFGSRFIMMFDIQQRQEHIDDIEQYIRKSLTQTAYSGWPEDVKGLATEVLLSKSQGMFL